MTNRTDSPRPFPRLRRWRSPFPADRRRAGRTLSVALVGVAWALTFCLLILLMSSLPATS